MEIQPHWRDELTKLRCWLSGWKAGRSVPGTMNLENIVPGEEVLRQLIMAIDEAKKD